MRTYNSGDKVKGGFYWNAKEWSIVTVSGKTGVLPRGEAHRYIKIPTLLLLLVAPVMGLLYVIFLPFIGFAFVLGLAGTKAVKAIRRVAGPAMRSMHWAEK